MAVGQGAAEGVSSDDPAEQVRGYLAPSGSVVKKMVYHLSHLVRGWRTDGQRQLPMRNKALFSSSSVFKALGPLKSLCAYLP